MIALSACLLRGLPRLRSGAVPPDWGGSGQYSAPGVRTLRAASPAGTRALRAAARERRGLLRLPGEHWCASWG